MRSKKEKELSRQRIQKKRGGYARDRKKKFSLLKRTGRLGMYYAQRAGLQKKKITIKSFAPEKPPTGKISFRKKSVYFFKKLFKRI